MRKAILLAVFLSLPVSAQAQTNPSNPFIMEDGVLRQLTDAELSARTAATNSSTSAQVADRPNKSVTRQQLADTFQTCVAAGGTAAQIVACIKDVFVALKSQ